MNNNNVGYFSRSNKIFDDFLNKLAKSQESIINKDQVLKDFENFERTIRKSPQIMRVFAALKHKFETDPDYTAQVDSNFVAGIMLLDLPSEASNEVYLETNSQSQQK